MAASLKVRSAALRHQHVSNLMRTQCCLQMLNRSCNKAGKLRAGPTLLLLLICSCHLQDTDSIVNTLVSDAGGVQHRFPSLSCLL